MIKNQSNFTQVDITKALLQNQSTQSYHTNKSVGLCAINFRNEITKKFKKVRNRAEPFSQSLDISNPH